jgi:CheY-like chemotaxis protein
MPPTDPQAPPGINESRLRSLVDTVLDTMVEQTPDDHPLRTFIRPSIEADEHGAELTKQLLAFGRKQTLQPKVICANQLLEHFTSLVRHTLGERIEVLLALPPNIWNVKVDPVQLQNVLLNLAVNARDAMPGGGKLIFETRNASLDADYISDMLDVTYGDYVVIAISDTGIGMAAEVAEKAFEPFFTTKASGQGSGIGLSMVYGFVKQSRGHIKLYSEPGHGTSVKIYLPRADGDATSTEPTAALPIQPNTVPNLVLVVEDNHNVLQLTSAMVESLGYQVLQAESGDIAIDILRSRPDIKLLLTDVMLPGKLNGPTLAKQALLLYPQLKVLFNSGYAEHAIIQSGLLDDGMHIISKPFRKQQLVEKMQYVLKN